MRKLLTIRELAAATTLSLSTIERLIKSGVLRPVQLGGKGHRRMFDGDEIDRWLQAARAPTAHPPSDCPAKPKRVSGPRPKWMRPA